MPAVSDAKRGDAQNWWHKRCMKKGPTKMILEMLTTTPTATRRWGSANRDRGTRAAFLLALLSLATSGFAETAYSALWIVSARRGEEIFQRVIEVRGDGKREPTAWTIVLADPRARSGVR